MIGREITIGQYLAIRTPLHRLDPRLKVLSVVAGTVLIFLYSNGWQLLVFFTMVMIVLIASRIPLLRVFASLKTVWVIVLVTFLLQMFLTPGEVLWRWGFLSVTDSGLANAAIFSGRVLILVVLLAALTMTTSPLKLADGLESLLKPLGYLRIPVGRMTTIISITLLFIPNILDESHKLIRAQMARGADFESANLLRRVRDIVPVLVPLFVKIFHDADELALAMEARVYSAGKDRTRLHPLRIGPLQAVLTALFVGASLAIAFVL